MNIPNEAVETAAKAIHENGGFYSWEDPEGWREKAATEEARAALESAAPILMHRAWVEGYRVGEVDCFLGEGGDQPAENKSPYGRKSL